MQDMALENFMKRFGDIEDAPGVPKPMLGQKLQMGADGTGLAKSAGLMGEQKNDWQMGTEETTFKGESVGNGKPGGDFLGKAGGIASEVSQAAPDAISLVSNATGGQFETDADTGGPGKAGGAILQGASQGASVGGTIGGLLGPKGKIIGQAVGAVGGGLASTFAHKAAMNKFYDNTKTKNLDDMNQTQNENREDYRMSKGLADVAASKDLLKRQLNITV